MYDRILYPTDGSDQSAAALENVRDLATTYDASVDVLYVADTAHDLFGLGGDPMEEDSSGMVGHPAGSDAGMVGDRTSVDDVRSAVETHGEQLVEDTADLFGDVETQTIVKGGDPRQVILSYAEAAGVDIIVMGTHGRTGLDRYTLGSVAEKVVRLSDVPVLTVRSNTDGED